MIEARQYGQMKNNLDRLKLTQFSLHIDEYIDAIQGGEKSFTLTSNVKARASIFSNAGSKVEEVDFSKGNATVQFPSTATRLIGVIPSLGISDCRASAVRMRIPAVQKQLSPGKDELDGGKINKENLWICLL